MSSESSAPRAASPAASRRWVPMAAGVVGASVAAGAIARMLAVGPSWGGPAGMLVSAVLSPVALGLLGVLLVVWGVWSHRDHGAADGFLYAAPGALVLLSATWSAVGPGARLAWILASAFLVGWYTLVLQQVYRRKQLDARSMSYFLDASLLGVVVGAGWFLWALNGAPYALAVGVVAAPFVLLRAVLEPVPASAERVPWILRPFWAFRMLLFIFLGEFFLGALLDLEVTGRGFLQYIPFVAIHGSTAAALGNAVYDGLWFGAAILASAWFLIALGVTMGTLVLFRMREVHVAAQKYRMGLMIGVYALAAIYLPSLASSTPVTTNRTLASLPVIGWGFGLRSGGPFESGVFLAVLVMYACVGVLTVLFGRKALCAVMCGAAMMYQGTTMHEMREFNQTSRVGRYFLGSQLSTAYAVASVLALTSLFAISLLAWLHRLPTVQVANGEFDTSALPLPIELYFGGVWFVMFVSTPYIGTYNCATTGFCHWGALSIPFAKVSMFRLKVKDKKVCQECTTFDCAKSCPVGLVDMPLYFRTTGEFRSTKCCGVGDCVGACPYGNIYHQDVRFWVLRGLKRLSGEKPRTELPMVGAVRAVAPPAPGGGPGPASTTGAGLTTRSR